MKSCWQPDVEVDHVTVYRWVQRFTPLLADVAGFARHSQGDRWFVDETYVKVNGVWRYVCRAVDQHGLVVDVLVSVRRDGEPARRFCHRALTTLTVTPIEVVTGAALVYLRILDELVPAAWHRVEQHEYNRIEADHSRLKHRLRPMRGLRTDGTAQVVITGLAFLQISAAAITNSPPKQSALCGSRPRLPNSPKRSKQVRHGASLPTDQATQQRRSRPATAPPVARPPRSSRRFATVADDRH